MIFQEKLKYLRSLPQFKVIPISEVKTVAFAAKERAGKLYLNPKDIEKIAQEYPDLKKKLELLTV